MSMNYTDHHGVCLLTFLNLFILYNVYNCDPILGLPCFTSIIKWGCVNQQERSCLRVFQNSFILYLTDNQQKWPQWQWRSRPSSKIRPDIPFSGLTPSKILWLVGGYIRPCLYSSMVWCKSQRQMLHEMLLKKKGRTAERWICAVLARVYWYITSI